MTLDIDFPRSSPLIFLQSMKVKNCSKLVKAIVKVVENYGSSKGSGSTWSNLVVAAVLEGSLLVALVAA